MILFPRNIWITVAGERDRAHEVHGATSMESTPPDDPTGRRLRVLLEEVGEVAKEFNDAEHEGRPVNLPALGRELVQVAAMAGAWADEALRVHEGCEPAGGCSAPVAFYEDPGCPAMPPRLSREQHDPDTYPGCDHECLSCGAYVPQGGSACPRCRPMMERDAAAEAST